VSRGTKGQWWFTALLAITSGTFVLQSGHASAEEPTPVKVTNQSAPKAEDVRKVKTKVPPVYPQLARTMHVRGTVRVLVVITPAGAVKNVKALGGHPLLLESVMDAVKRWKYEPGPQETTMVVEFKFFDEGS
jgi:TonB family protein